MTSIKIKLEKCWQKYFYQKDISSRALDNNEINNAQISLLSLGKSILIGFISQNMYLMANTNKPIVISVQCVVDEMKESKKNFQRCC